MPPKTGLYLHWPYCDRICPYCDFNVTRSRSPDLGRWRDILCEDIRYWADVTGSRVLESVYFGGGTPSLMPPWLIETVLEEVSQQYSVSDDIEITLEANPTDAETASYSAWRSVGINRLSLGVQSFDDQHLAFLGRNHDGVSARIAVDRALEKFSALTFDLIYGLPMEDVSAWQERLAHATSLGAQHLSAYQLTVEPGTAFHNAVKRGQWTPPQDEMSSLFYDATVSGMEVAGYDAYEVSNFAKPSFRARHNTLYWQAADWIGIGPGAAGRLTTMNERWETIGLHSIRMYQETPLRERYERATLSSDEQLMEWLASGLRLKEGVSLEAVSAETRETLAPKITDLSEQGWLAQRQDQLWVTPKGRVLTDAVVKELINQL